MVYANTDNYRVIERALNQLDRPIAQVAVDVTIAEVHLNNDLQYGVQFFLGNIGIPNLHTLGAVGVNSPTGNTPLQNQPGFNLILGNQLTPHVIISALNQYTTTKILANPSLVVLDNQTAALQVGQQVPITQGSANILNSATAHVKHRLQFHHLSEYRYYFELPAACPRQRRCESRGRSGDQRLLELCGN